METYSKRRKNNKYLFDKKKKKKRKKKKKKKKHNRYYESPVLKYMNKNIEIAKIFNYLAIVFTTNGTFHNTIKN